VMLAEYVTRMPLVEYPNDAAPVYRLLASQPAGVVAEFPVPRFFPGRDAEFAYMSTFHWKPLINGYSGHFPKSYVERLPRLLSFPHRVAIEQLRSAGVRYVVVHAYGYPKRFNQLRRELLRSEDLVELGLFDDVEGPALLYLLKD
jgi:hypothetical protein